MARPVQLPFVAPTFAWQQSDATEYSTFAGGWRRDELRSLPVDVVHARFEGWLTSFRDLVARGLTGVRLVAPMAATRPA